MWHAKLNKEQDDEVSDPEVSGMTKEQMPATKKIKMEKEKSYWRNWYVIVFVFLMLQIILYYFITQHFKN